MLVLVLNGPINAGKTTTGKALSALLAGACFVDGDDHDAHERPFLAMVEAAFLRLEGLIARASEPILIIAYPLRDADYRRLLAAAEARGATFRVVTLAPPVAVALTNRGTRQLQQGEVERSREMYAEGYASRSFSDLVITEMHDPASTAQQICQHFAMPVRH